MNRAIWSAPPPVEAGTTKVTGLVGCHFCARTGDPITATATASTTTQPHAFTVHLLESRQRNAGLAAQGRAYTHVMNGQHKRIRPRLTILPTNAFDQKIDRLPCD